MRVIFLRHGESEYNVKGLINQNPKVLVALTTRGRKQAKEVAKKLNDLGFDAIFISEFPRTKQTAEIINKKRGLSIIVDKKLNEVRVGHEGETSKESGFYSIRDFFTYNEKGFETWKEFKTRIKSFFGELKKSNYESVLVVAHEWIVTVANAIVNNLTDEEMLASGKIGNCEFVELEI